MSAQVHDAISRIEPLSGVGPNLFTVEVDGWGLSAPTTLQLKKMLWGWFHPRPSEVEHLAAVEVMLDGFAATPDPVPERGK